MTPDICQEQVNRLFDNYSVSAAPAARKLKIQLILREFKYVSNEAFIKVCDRLMNDTKIRDFPKISDFKDRLFDNKSQNISPINTIKGCERCENTGYYTVWQKRENQGRYYSFVFKCSCLPIEIYKALPLIDPQAIPTRAHNPFPPTDGRHKEFNLRRN
jgi:hypothetical protein